ncbi:hypothetical protein [Nostoc sp. TCL26-01]|nr:hypothetical protein [Nostoc sp. TCL26-01]
MSLEYSQAKDCKDSPHDVKRDILWLTVANLLESANKLLPTISQLFGLG